MSRSELLERCRICPRACGTDRSSGGKGYCGVSADTVVARAALHMWEEPCISGKEGSGTVFFAGCNLRCVYCQNHEISRASAGVKITVERLADIFLELRDKGANNINLVTPTHYVPNIVDALELARSKGLRLPVVYNSGGYESIDTLRMLEGYVDVWLPDFKYKSDTAALRYSGARDYFERASAAIAEMVRQTGGECVFDRNGIMTRGVIVRHLVLPGQTADSKRILRYLHDTYGDSIYISIMNQFTPVTDLSDYPEINRKLTDEEYERVICFAERIGITRAYVQTGDTAEESFIPAFDCEGVLPASTTE
ncbi:MAG: radical SAM protein [Lachnospiraceae bacterium]|nr:radical SAM protein [Lachnospiraceae bacterium]